MPNAVVLVASPHDPAVAEPFFGYLLGDGWTVRGFSSQDDVPDDVAGEAEFVIAALSPTGAPLIGRAPKLRLIQVPGHGYDHVDVPAARAAGVPVATVASSGAEAHTVAEWAILMAGAASRRLVQGHNALARGEFATMTLMQAGVFELAGKTIGIVGLGRIGREVVKRARAFDMHVIYHDAFRLRPEDEDDLGIAYRELDALLGEADVITIHVPSMPSTRGLIGKREIELCKREAIIVNTARGDVVDHDALVDALRSSRIRAAAIDVFEREPPPPDDPLLTIADVTLSPHMAGVTAESLLRILQAAAANCNRMARGEEPHDVIGEGGPH
jgi:phosphoglycerate dehydrogenase-like enzyme